MNRVLRMLGVCLVAFNFAHLDAQTTPHYLITNDDNPFGNTASFYTIGTNGKLTYKTSVATGGLGTPGEFATGHSVLVTQIGTENCAFLANNGSNDISGIDLATLKLTEIVPGPNDGAVSGVTLRANSQYVYAAYEGGIGPTTGFGGIVAYQKLPGCKLKQIGSVALNHTTDPQGFVFGWLQGNIAVHDNILVAIVFDSSGTKVESFNLSKGIPQYNHDLQDTTAKTEGLGFPYHVEITSDGKFAVFDTQTVVEVADISSGKLSKPTVVYKVGAPNIFTASWLSPDETLLYRLSGDAPGATTPMVFAYFFDKATGAVKQGCNSTNLKGQDTTWVYAAGLYFSNSTQGTGGPLYVAEWSTPPFDHSGSSDFSDPSQPAFITTVNVTSDGKTCSLAEVPGAQMYAPYSFMNVPDLGTFPPRPF